MVGLDDGLVLEVWDGLVDFFLTRGSLGKEGEVFTFCFLLEGVSWFFEEELRNRPYSKDRSV